MNTSPDNSSSSGYSGHVYDRVQPGPGHPGGGAYLDPDDNWDQQFENIPPPPPPAQTALTSAVGSSRAVSLYPYDASTQALQESNLPMAEGEEFDIVEPDSDGWTRVRRVDNKYYNDDGEGYVPSSFLKLIP